MVTTKIPIQPRLAGSYTDDPNAASSSSAVLLGDVDSYPDEELPAYTDVPPSVSKPPTVPPTPRPQPYRPPTDLPFSSQDYSRTQIRTLFPNYSADANTLFTMISDQASFPPTYFVRLTGTHTETSRNGNKETKNKITDFVIKINITNLLQSTPGLGGEMHLLPDSKYGYRGGIFPSTKPVVGPADDEAQFETLRAWCEHYVSNRASTKSFLLTRTITNHDTVKLEQLLRSAIYETGYRGHLVIDFPTQHKSMIVYSPSKLNTCRLTNWICWIFYLTFLWVISWPVLFFITKKYAVLKVVWPYADRERDDAGTGDRKCVVMSETEWFLLWEGAVKRAAVARMRCEDRALDEEWRAASMRANEQRVQGRQVEVPRTGNAFADGVVGVLSEGLRVAEGWNAQRGWGGDC